jgi:hypothetical protein
MKINQRDLDALIDILQVKFPNVLPPTSTSLENIHMKIGQQQVIKYLKEIAETQK